MGYPVQNTCTRGIKLETVFQPAIRIALSSAEKIRCALGLYDFVATEGSARVLASFERGCKSRRPAGLGPSVAACVKKRVYWPNAASGELVPIPEYLLSTSFVPRKFRKIPGKFRQNLAKNQQNSGKVCAIFGKN